MIHRERSRDEMIPDIERLLRDRRPVCGVAAMQPTRRSHPLQQENFARDRDLAATQPLGGAAELA
jgi:hypothetical protein